MSLQPFSFPFPQTRFFKAGAYIYKFKIRGGSSYSGMEATGENFCNLEEEMEDIIRTVMGNLERLQPFTSTHFHVYPYKKQWERVSQVMCEHSDKKLKTYPFTLILYLEKNMHRDTVTENKLVIRQEEEEQLQCVCEPLFSRHRSDSPLEDTILKDLAEDMEAESEVSVVRFHGLDLLPREDSEDDSQPDDKNIDVNAVTGTGTPEEDEEDEEEDPQEAIADEILRKPTTLSKLARRLFPFSLFFRDT